MVFAGGIEQTQRVTQTTHANLIDGKLAVIGCALDVW
jgi:hypothetical protein